MSEDKKNLGRHHTADNYRPDVIKNYRPITAPPDQGQSGRHNVDGNYVPETGSGQPKSPPPKPKK
jgi:hypothetical protein